MSTPDPLAALRSAAQREQEVRQAVREASDKVRLEREQREQQPPQEVSQNGDG